MGPRTPLCRPDEYFAQRDPDPVHGLILAVALTMGALAAVWGLGVIFADNVDGSVGVDNPNRPPEQFCDDGASETFEQVNASGFDCSAPAEVERDVDTIISDAVGQFYAPILVGLPLVLLFAGVVLHVGTAIVGGDGGFSGTLTVAAWGFAPMFVVMPVSLFLLWAMMDPVTVTPGTDPTVFRESVLGSLQQWRPFALGLNAVGSLWGAVIWTFGLESARSVSRSEAAVVAGTVTLLFLIGGLL